jgi:hypothetical protein
LGDGNLLKLTILITVTIFSPPLNLKQQGGGSSFDNFLLLRHDHLVEHYINGKLRFENIRNSDNSLPKNWTNPQFLFAKGESRNFKVSAENTRYEKKLL